MSFGFSIGDVTLLRHLAWKTVQATAKACGEHDERTKEISNLHVVVRRLEQEIEKRDSPINRRPEDTRDELLSIISGSEDMLKILNTIFDKYNALGMEDRSGRKLWQKVLLGDGRRVDLANLKKTAKYHTSRITLFLNMLSTGILGRGSVEPKRENARRVLIPPDLRLDVNDVVARYLSETDSEFLAFSEFSKDDAVLWKKLQAMLVDEDHASSSMQEPMHLIKEYVGELGDRFLFDKVEMQVLRGEGRGDSNISHTQNYVPDEALVGPGGVDASTAYPLQTMTVQLRDVPLQQASWLPFSELALWPYPQRYSNARRSLTPRFGQIARSIRACHVFIFLGFLTIVGSLVPAIWRSVARNDISGGFSLAQYILGVGVFVIGCMVAVHSKSCTCWQ